MSEATIQVLGTPLPNEEPFIGDGAENELVVNTADGRLWAFDPSDNPVELGGACVNIPIGNNLFASNRLELDVTNPDNLPIPIPDPLTTPPGVAREIRILMRFVQDPINNLVTYFDYGVSWGNTPDHPLSTYAMAGSVVLIELSCYGPMAEWMGRVIWAKTAT